MLRKRKATITQEAELQGHWLTFVKGALPLVDCDLSPWCRIGELRGLAARNGGSLSTPDAHIAQSAMDLKGALVSADLVFRKLIKGICPTLILSA